LSRIPVSGELAGRAYLSSQYRISKLPKIIEMIKNDVKKSIRRKTIKRCPIN